MPRCFNPREEELAHDDPARECIGPPRPEDPPLEDDAGETMIPYDERLARFGYSSLTSAVTSWWKRWRGARNVTTDDIGGPLRRAARGRRRCHPQGALLAWLREHEWRGAFLSPEEAGGWLHVWTTANRVHCNNDMPLQLRDARRMRPSRSTAVRLGQAMFNRRQSLRGLQDGDRWIEDPVRIDSLLWGNRPALWTSAPDEPPHSDQILQQYFSSRAAEFPPAPRPKVSRLAGAILSAKGSAPRQRPWS